MMTIHTHIARRSRCVKNVLAVVPDRIAQVSAMLLLVMVWPVLAQPADSGKVAVPLPDPCDSQKLVQSVEVVLTGHPGKKAGRPLVVRVFYDSLAKQFGESRDADDWSPGIPYVITVNGTRPIPLSDFNRPAVEVVFADTCGNCAWTTLLSATAVRCNGDRLPIVRQGEPGELSARCNNHHVWSRSFPSAFPGAADPARTIVPSDFVVVSAVKTIFGTAPKNEFVDLTMRFNWRDSGSWFTIVEFNVPLSNGGDSTSGSGSVVQAIGQGAISVNLVPSFADAPTSPRQGFGGGEIRIFNGEPYAGIHIGGIEKDGQLLSSFITIGFLRRLSPLQNFPTKLRKIDSLAALEGPDTPSPGLHPIPFNNNLFLGFALHASHIDYFKNTRIKGGILMPLFDLPGINSNPGRTYKWHPSDIQFNIAIEIPIGGVMKLTDSTKASTEKSSTEDAKDD